MSTVARLIDKDNGLIIARGVAKCSKMDLPSRKVGRELAVSRCLESYLRAS